MTRSILEQNPRSLIVVEKDPRFLPSLHLLQESFPEKLVIIKGDALEVDEAELLQLVEAPKTSWEEPAGVQVIGNLPFNISTPLLLKWLRQLSKREGTTFLQLLDLISMTKSRIRSLLIRPSALYSALSKGSSRADGGRSRHARVLSPHRCSWTECNGKAAVYHSGQVSLLLT